MDTHDIQHTQDLLIKNYHANFASRQTVDPLWTHTQPDETEVGSFASDL